MGCNKELLDMWQVVSLIVFVLQNLAPSVMAVQTQCLGQMPPVLNKPAALLACGKRSADIAEIVFHSRKYHVSSHRAYQHRDTPTEWIAVTCLVGVSISPSLMWVQKEGRKQLSCLQINISRIPINLLYTWDILMACWNLGQWQFSSLYPAWCCLLHINESYKMAPTAR